MHTAAYAGDILPLTGWEILENHTEAVLVDVRTPAEWSYVGVPDLSSLGRQPLFIPWALYPDMTINPTFSEQVEAAGVSPQAPLLFLCRSGVRSRSAAVAMTAAGFSSCYNIAHGFEGDHNPARRRGAVNGWKVAGLPWVQG